MENSGSMLGLIAGQGILPFVVAKNAKEKGYNVTAVLLEHLADKKLEDKVDIAQTFNAGKIGGIIKFLKNNGVRQVVMAGKVPKKALYDGGIKPDLRAAALLFKLKDRSDDTILDAVSAEFKKEGMKALGIMDFCTEFVTPNGVITKKKPDKMEKEDIEFGFRMAKGIGGLDIGQTVIVKNKAVMAVEAIEGTDEAIKRGVALSGGGAVVVKVSRPGQDMRFDVPVVGIKTLNIMIDTGASALAVEAGKSIFLDKEEFIARADKAGISVVGISNP